MSDEERRRQEEERRRFERIRSLDTGTQETSTGRRRHPAGSQPFNIDPLSSASPLAVGVQETPTGRRRHAAGGHPSFPAEPLSSAPPLARTRSYGEIPADMYLSEQFRQGMNLGTQPYQTESRFGRQTSGQRTRQTDIPHFARQEPIPDTQLVQRYRDPATGELSLDRLRQPSIRPPPWGGGPTTSQQMGSYLANLSKDNISQGILAHDSKHLQRKKDVMLTRGFQRVQDRSIKDRKAAERFAPGNRPVDRSQRRGFEPQTQRDLVATRDYRFNRPQRVMDRPVFRPFDSKFAPVGRQQWGPLRRAYSMPDLSDPNLAADINEPSRMAQFEKRLVQMPTTDRETYRQFQRQVSLAENPDAMSRMVPRPTIGNIRDMDRRRLKEMAHYRAQLMQHRIGGHVSADDLRQARRNIVRDSAYQETALPTDTEQDLVRAYWLAQGVQEGIPEEEDEGEEEE